MFFFQIIVQGLIDVHILRRQLVFLLILFCFICFWTYLPIYLFFHHIGWHPMLILILDVCFTSFFFCCLCFFLFFPYIYSDGKMKIPTASKKRWKNFNKWPKTATTDICVKFKKNIVFQISQIFRGKIPSCDFFENDGVKNFFLTSKNIPFAV